MSAEDVLTQLVRSIGLQVDELQLQSDDADIVQLRQFMNEAGNELVRRAEWSALNASEAFAAGAASYTLPTDFNEISESGMVFDTAGNVYQVIVSAAQWAYITARTSTTRYCRIQGSSIEFSQTADNDVALPYQSKNWIDGDKSEITQNGDLLLVPEKLVFKGALWRWRRQKGLPFDDHMAEFEADLAEEIKKSRGAA